VLAKVPVLLLSGVVDVNQTAKSLKAVDYLTKPVDLEKLYSLVARYC
jgi:FixJ family two-component response regulator